MIFHCQAWVTPATFQRARVFATWESPTAVIYLLDLLVAVWLKFCDNGNNILMLLVLLMLLSSISISISISVLMMSWWHFFWNSHAMPAVVVHRDGVHLWPQGAAWKLIWWLGSRVTQFSARGFPVDVVNWSSLFASQFDAMLLAIENAWDSFIRDSTW